MLDEEIIEQNKKYWNEHADLWYGTTALPQYGVRFPTEDELHLFGDVRGKSMLEICCGSGHSLVYNAKKGAKELWGVDLSQKQLDNAAKLLAENGCSANLFCAKMEDELDVPKGYFDFVYSIYGIGWTTDLQGTFDIFYPETVKSFRSRHIAVNPDHVWHRLDDTSYLERIGAASISDVDGKLHPTVAGLLMFGEEYKIRQEYPEYFLDYREMLDPSIRWTDRLESSSGEWSGNLLDFFFQMERKLFRDLKKPFMLDGITRVDETPVHKAIREALANCIANADFNFTRGIVIIKNPETIIIENPGSIITGKAQMLKGGVSEPRNKSIIKMFNLIRIGERAGSGVPDIFSVWNDEGWIPPTVDELYKPDRTVLTLAFSKKQATSGKNKRQTEKTSDKRKKQAETERPLIINKL